MGKLIILLSTFIFSMSLQARTDPKTGLDKADDPNLKINSLKRLHGLLPTQNVTSGVCTDPEGCQEDRLVQASLKTESAFEKQSPAQQNGQRQDGSRNNK